MEQRSSRTGHTAALALTGVSLALWTAAAHLTVVVITRVLTRDMYWAWSGRDVWWMVPLAYLLLFAVPVCLLVLLHAVAPRAAQRSWIVGAWAALGLFSVLLLYARAHSWTLALLALGGGAQLGAMYRKHEGALGRFVRRGAFVLALFFALFGVGGAILRDVSARRAWASVGPISEDERNVLLIILDTVRARSMSLYGSQRATTPRLAAWAERGVTFEQAYAASSWTLPSHASMFTGVYPSQHAADWVTTLDATHRTVAEVLRSRGYATGAFVSNLLAAGHESGLSRGFMVYDDVKRSLSEIAQNTTVAQGDAVVTALSIWRRERWLGGIARVLRRFDLRPTTWTVSHAHKAAPDVIAPFLRWQSSLGNRPFFAFLNFFDAHNTPRTPSPYLEMFGGATNRDAYDGSLRYLDDQIGGLLDELERRGALRNTVVIITSDHGELFGEHGLSGHGNSLYRDVLRVPLLILSTDSAGIGRRITTQVSLRDLAATSLTLAGVRGMTLPGRSLSEHWRSAHAETSPVLAEVSQGVRDDPKNPTAKGDMIAVVDDTLHIIREGDGTVFAYAYRSDSAEAHNLAVAASAQRFLARLSAVYDQALGRVQARSTSLRSSGWPSAPERYASSGLPLSRTP